MLKNLLELPDGTKLFSGSATENAVKSVTLTQCVNSEDELTLGSTCANMLEATLITPNGGLSLTAGDEVTLYKVDDANTLRKVGVFALEQPTRPTANTMKLTGYDRVTKLDKDLTEWLKGLDGWPYNILTFAEMVCEACGLSFIRSDVPNSDYSVESFSIPGVTGRQIMKWIGEVCCCFCRANANGNIEMGWYKPLTTHAIGYKEGCYISVSDDGSGTVSIDGIDVQSDSDANGNVTVVSDRITVNYDEQGNVDLTIQNLDTLVYFQNGLSYEEYDVAPVDAVQIQFADGDNAYRWPAADDGANCYVISGNPMLNSTTDTVKRALQTICAQLEKITYTPCKVSLPSVLDIQAGHVVRIVDKNKKSITMLVMTKKTTGQKDTYECTGSHRRDSTTAQNNQSPSKIASQEAQKAVDSQTQEDIFKKLTNGGEEQGIFFKDKKIYINAMYVSAGTFTSTATVFIEPGMEECETIKDHILGKATIPDERKALYDFDGSGDVSINDFIICRGAFLGNRSLEDWDGAVKSTVIITLDPSNTTKTVRINGTNMWGREIEYYIGIKGANFGLHNGNLAVNGNLAIGDNFMIGFDSDGNAQLTIGKLSSPKKLSWSDNGDGTFSLIGT